MQSLTQNNYLASGYMINKIFGTNTHEPESLWLVTDKGIKPYLELTPNANKNAA